MNPFPTPRFVFDANDPRTSPGFVLILTLAKHRRALDQLRFQSLDFFTGGRPASCLAVLIVGLSDQPTPEQLQRLHRLSRRWGVAVEAAASAEAAVGFGSWLLGEFHRLFHDSCEALPGALQIACLRQMCQDAIEEVIRRPLKALTAIPAF